MTERLTGDALEARIKELEAERDKLIAETPYAKLSTRVSTHSKIRVQYANKIAFIRKHGRLPYERHAGALQYDNASEHAARIKELEELRDAELANTPFVRYAPRKTSHGIIKQRYNGRINNLLKYGVEFISQLHDVKCKVGDTKLARFGSKGVGNIDKMKATKIVQFGNAFGPMDKITQVKLERYGKSNGCVNIQLATQTKLERYGNKWGGDLKRRAQATAHTNMVRYGVPYYCMTTHCKLAQGHIISKQNQWWQRHLLESLNIQFEFEQPQIESFTYDLCYENIAIEINPTFTHNSAYSFEYMTGRSATNWHRHANSHADKCCKAMSQGYRCITIWDWDDANAIVALLKSIIDDTEQLKTADVITIDLSKEDPTKYVDDYKLVSNVIQCHWHNMRTGEHFIDNDISHAEDYNAAGFLPVYDCGLLTLQRKQLSNI